MLRTKEKSLEGNLPPSDPNFDRKFEAATAGTLPFVREHLLNRITHKQCQVIISYILAFQVESSLSETNRMHTIQILKQLAQCHGSKDFLDMTRDDVITFLERLRKPESVDPLHKWIGTYENNRMLLFRFFKWLHAPDVPAKLRETPDVVNNIPEIKRRELAIYTATSLWTEDDDFIFVKYCPSKRGRAFHLVARDTGARPHELLGAKIQDIEWINTDSYQVARITVNGKTMQKILPITQSSPWLKDWLTNGHPYPSVPTMFVFCGDGRKNTGRRLRAHSMNAVYANYKNVIFPRLLDNPAVSPEDKEKIRELLKKPWNPYIRRHTAINEKMKILPMPELHQFAGWKPNSKMSLRYVHLYNNQACNTVFAKMGLNIAGTPPSNKDKLKPRVCPECSTGNKPDAKICCNPKCRLILSTKAALEIQKETEDMKQELRELKSRQQAIEIKLETNFAGSEKADDDNLLLKKYASWKIGNPANDKAK
jgi:integrase/recombinase XerD